MHYEALSLYIRSTFVLAEGSPIAVGAGYGGSDAFFKARGRYSVIRTCNQWSGQALRLVGAPVGRWTPFSFLVTWHLPAVRD